jgi:hypothetical protein
MLFPCQKKLMLAISCLLVPHMSETSIDTSMSDASIPYPTSRFLVCLKIGFPSRFINKNQHSRTIQGSKGSPLKNGHLQNANTNTKPSMHSGRLIKARHALGNLSTTTAPLEGNGAKHRRRRKGHGFSPSTLARAI